VPDKTMKRFLVNAAIVLLFFSSGIAASLGVDIPYEQVFSRYSASITKISYCSSWQEKGKRGDYRIIELSMYGQSFLYVDRVALNDGETMFTVLDGISIKELNNDHAELTLTKLSCKAAKNGIVIKAKAESGHDGSLSEMTIHMQMNGTYSIKGL
jgi:hypothetical protein